MNFHIDPDVIARALPAPFRPKLVNGHAMGGICLIRLTGIRPRFLPIPWGIRSENAAHRIAVEWDVDGVHQEGVYIPRRDTDSRLNAWAGGTIFPGIHQLARFRVKESDDCLFVGLESNDGETRVVVSGAVASQLPRSSVFSSLAAASKFFESGSLGYSASNTNGQFDGLELRCASWHVQPLEIDRVESSYFQNETRFPAGSVEFDCALLMRGVRHEWHGRDKLHCSPPTPA